MPKRSLRARHPRRHDPTVGTYRLVTAEGRPIRRATFVRFKDGSEVRFTEKMSKRQAVKQAKDVRKEDLELQARAGIITHTEKREKLENL